jgi:hypothetical protein
MRPGRNVLGGRLLVVLGDELSDGKNKNRESDGAFDFDGICWMGGRTNQPKVGLHVRIWLGGRERREMTMGEDAVRSFRPSNEGAKNMKNKIRRGLRRPPIDD